MVTGFLLHMVTRKRYLPTTLICIKRPKQQQMQFEISTVTINRTCKYKDDESSNYNIFFKGTEYTIGSSANLLCEFQYSIFDYGNLILTLYFVSTFKQMFLQVEAKIGQKTSVESNMRIVLNWAQKTPIQMVFLQPKTKFSQQARRLIKEFLPF